ncbi:uncharacterized protein si:ch211-122l24.6 isoform X1 [Triplophysa dalaica]|uniref:uncharacterized protein si:ch211-122l24.6 isoform X1 n=1 Tax=Triplophysa dalaica TaxID=1582913 RepID=UPI0024DFBD95|nr:uncharacterized protein si:ch211-122l24.6 isoform X1 [Triplophysa dalaica]
MGLFLSFPLMTAPDCYELPSYEESCEDEDEADLPSELHRVNQRFCESIVQEGMRSRNEQANFDRYRHNWSEVVAEMTKKYPQWTPRDFFNLRHQFKVFDSNDLYLLHFNDFNKALDYNKDNSSPEQRRAMFDSVDTHHYNSINFEEYLQLLNNFNICTPILRAPKTAAMKDPVCLDIISDVTKADPFLGMSHSLF